MNMRMLKTALQYNRARRCYLLAGATAERSVDSEPTSELTPSATQWSCIQVNVGIGNREMITDSYRVK